MRLPLISCIVPVFNGERYLAETVSSIAHQTYRLLEIIIVNDGSTDRTEEIVSSYGSRVRYLRQRNAGPASARNLGLAGAKGEFVAFLDQDDLWHSEKLERQMARFADRNDLDLCITHVQSFCDPKLPKRGLQHIKSRMSGSVPGYLTGTLLARRTMFERVGNFNTELRYGDAADWFLRAIELGINMELLADVLMYHRIHQRNFSLSHASESCEEFLGIIKRSLDRRRGTGAFFPASYRFPWPI